MPASRKLYNDIAKAIYQQVWLSREFHGYVRSEISDLTVGIANCLLADNSNFNKDKFMRACGLPDLADN